MPDWPFELSRCSWVDDCPYLGDAICREATALCVLPDHFLVRSDVYAVDLVVGNIALYPLNLWSELFQDAAGFLRDALQCFCREATGSGDFALDHILVHSILLELPSAVNRFARRCRWRQDSNLGTNR